MKHKLLTVPLSRPGRALSWLLGANLLAVALTGCGDDPAPPADIDAGEPQPEPDAAPEGCLDCAWQPLGKLTPSEAGRRDRFGYNIALHNQLLVVSAQLSDLDDLDEGAAYVFEYNGTSWNEQAKLIAGDPDRDDEFGRSVAISDGTIAIGAWQDDEGANNAGAVYLFEREDGEFKQVDKLIAEDASENALFGNAIALDGDRLAVGASHEGAEELGAVYIFERGVSGWEQTDKLRPAGLSGEAHIGEAVALDGDLLAVAAPVSEGGGSAYLFEYSGASWSQIASLERPTSLPVEDRYGYDIAVNSNTVAVGIQRNGLQPGLAYVYRRANDWALDAALTGPNEVYQDQFGSVVTLSDDTFMLGAPTSIRGGTEGAGLVYEVRLTAGTWELSPPTFANRALENESFGFAIALDGDWLAVGTTTETVYVLERKP